MKGQSRIEFRARKSRISHSETPKAKNIEDKQLTKAFRPVEHIVSKPHKVEKPAVIIRKSSRLASKDLTQTVLNLKPIEKPTTATHDHHVKRKLETTAKSSIIKKQKQHHDEDKESPKDDISQITKDVVEETTTVSKEAHEVKETELRIATEETSCENVQVNKADSPTVEKAPLSNTNSERQQEDEQAQFSVADDLTSTIENTPTPHIQEDDALSTQDTLSPPSSFIEPMTPPRPSQQPYTAPHKEYLTETDKQRIEYETSTLEKLRKSLDIVITDRAARNRPTLYHQIESTLRISTRRTITLSHLCQIMYITPQLYTLEAKELRNYGGKVTEAFLIQFTKDWSMPLAGKDLQKRADILKSAITQYFIDHPQPDATIPEMTLPRLNLVIDKEEWLKKAPLPTGVRKLIEAHEKAKEAEAEREKPKPKPTGSVKDRMAALRARLAKKSA
ncbi:unnamed protein product [Mucor circinelloides]